MTLLHTTIRWTAAVSLMTTLSIAGCASSSPAPSATATPPAPAATEHEQAMGESVPTPQWKQEAGHGSNRAARSSSMGALNLYGQLPATTMKPASASANQGGTVSGPLDGPDNLRRVSFASEGDDFDPAASPDGQWIVYASTQHRATSDLYLKRIDGNTVTQLTNDPADDAMPVFSPDGRKLAFASNRSGNWDIYLMDAAGGQAVQLTSDATHDLHPSFSPDGRKLVYCSFGGQSGQWELVVIDVENPAIKHYIGHGLMPSWSPVDNRIVFQRARGRGTRWFSVWTIEYVNGEGQRPTEIAASSNAACITPEWAPDGKHIVFSTVINPGGMPASPSVPGASGPAQPLDRPTQADLWIIGADGNNRFRLTNGQFANLQPVWAPSGAILFVSNRAKDGVENIWSMPVQSAMTLVRGNATNQPAIAAAPAPGSTHAPGSTPAAGRLPLGAAASPTAMSESSMEVTMPAGRSAVVPTHD